MSDKPYDLEERTFQFAQDVRRFIKKLPRTVANVEDVRQLVRSSGSIGANYIEANEALSKKDRRCRIRVSRKEAKESRYWLRLVETGESVDAENHRARLLKECEEIRKILSTIIDKLDGVIMSAAYSVHLWDFGVWPAFFGIWNLGFGILH